jgi:hypothetical protein
MANSAVVVRALFPILSQTADPLGQRTSAMRLGQTGNLLDHFVNAFIYRRVEYTVCDAIVPFMQRDVNCAKALVFGDFIHEPHPP